MWLDTKKITEFDTNIKIKVFSSVSNLTDNINNSVNEVVDIKTCKWYCWNITVDNKWKRKTCDIESGCKNSRDYDDGLDIKFTI